MINILNTELDKVNTTKETFNLDNIYLDNKRMETKDLQKFEVFILTNT